MTKYEFINDPNNLGFIVKLIRNKISINSGLIQKLQIFEKFYQLSGDKLERYKIISKEFNIHYKTVQKIITNLNQKIK